MRRPSVKIFYLTHDLSDPATHKRCAMLTDGGASVALAGFRRTPEPVFAVAGNAPVDFGQTRNAGFVHRIASVLKQLILLKRHRRLFEDADIVIARNLEMLAIAVRGRSLCTRPPVLVYECLDIHRLLPGNGLPGIALRWLEGWLGKRASSLLTSSPAFIREYFDARSRLHLPTRLVENKIIDAPHLFAAIPPRPNGPPWRIGWFGAIRCRRSLSVLTELVQSSQGRIEVIIRGRPSLDQFDDFHALAARTPGLSFLGPYRNPDDLAAIYADVHFTWAIDMFEEGQNSAWLLPNRLYEGGACGAVPIALSQVETGRFLKTLGIGVILGSPLDKALAHFFAQLTPADYQEYARSALAISPKTWVYDKRDCEDLVDYLQALKA